MVITHSQPKRTSILVPKCEKRPFSRILYEKKNFSAEIADFDV